MNWERIRRDTEQDYVGVGVRVRRVCSGNPREKTIYVWVVDTASFMVTDIIHIGGMGPKGIDILPDGSRVYVASQFDDVVYVIDTASKTVMESIVVGRAPIAFGNFIIPSMQTSGPAIDSVRPKRLRKDRSTNVTIVGSNFVDGLSITVSPSDTGITVGRIRLSGSDEIRAFIAVDADATSGPYNLTVSNPSGESVTLERAFTIAR